MDDAGMSDLPDPAAVLPHEAPFLFVDAVTAIDDDTIEGRWHLTGDEAFFAGHFPGQPVLPGVLMAESLAQLGAIAVITERGLDGGLPLFGGIDRARFRRQVIPGETLDLSVTMLRRSARAGKAEGTATVNGELACEARIFFVIADVESAPP